MSTLQGSPRKITNRLFFYKEVGNSKCYDGTVLSSDEINQNYQALRTRFL